ncbi:MAG: DNA gyrase inhibitor YacG [Terriglobales bacterium]
MTKVRSLRCPTCRKIVLREEPDFPFCSERCRLIDLGKWASGGYVISGPTGEADQYGDPDYTIPNSPATQRRPAPSSSANRSDGKDKH